jgi:hypothetical protein
MGRGQKFSFDDDNDACVFLFGINSREGRGERYLPCAIGYIFLAGD